MKKLLWVLLLAIPLFSSQVSAGTFSEARVTLVRVDSTGIGMVVFDQPASGTSPTCINAVAYKNALSFDTNTAGGKSILAVAIAAKATGSVVFAYGGNKCSIYNGAHVEDMDYMMSR